MCRTRINVTMSNRKICDIILIIVVFISAFCLLECTNVFHNPDRPYYLVSEAYNVTKTHFNQGRANYNNLKNMSLESINTFLDLVHMMNGEMARDVRSAIVKFYQIKYFHDFTNYVISMEEMVDITEHCLAEPREKLEQIRLHFRSIIANFQDVRDFAKVNKCADNLPDEVAAAHCILHQGVLFNETMQDSLLEIVEIKTRQHAQDMNISLYNVNQCFNYFVPKFFDQLLIDAYTENCGFLKVVNASISDLMKYRWKHNQTIYLQKWKPVVTFLKEKLKPLEQTLQETLQLTLYAANMTVPNNSNVVYSKTAPNF